MRFQVRASTFFQKCRDQQWYINQLLRQQSQNLSQIRELKDRLEREQMKNITLSQTTSDGMGKLTKYKIVKDTHVDELLLMQQQQQAIFNDAATTFSITDDLKKLSSDASRNRNRSGNHESHSSSSSCDSRKTDSSQQKPSSSEKTKEKSVEKSKQSSSATVSINEPKSTTTTSLAISFSSPNLNTSGFSSSSDSDYIDNACASVIKIQNLLDDMSSIDDNDNADESLNLVGENDVEYAELTQRMVFPPSAALQKAQIQADNATSSEESDLMILNLFEAATNSENSSTHSSSSSNTAALRPISSVLDNFETVPSSNLGALNSSNHKINNNNNNNLPSSESHEDETAHSLPSEIQMGCASPVWKTQVSEIFKHYLIFIIYLFHFNIFFCTQIKLHEIETLKRFDTKC